MTTIHTHATPGRQGLTYEDVAAIADEQAAAGQRPTCAPSVLPWAPGPWAPSSVT